MAEEFRVPCGTDYNTLMAVLSLREQHLTDCRETLRNMMMERLQATYTHPEAHYKAIDNDEEKTLINAT